MRRSLEQRLEREQGVRPHKRHRTRNYETAEKRRPRGEQRSRKQMAYLPSAVRILEIFHVAEKLWKAAYSFHSEGSAAAEAFVDRYLQMILEGKASCVMGVFRRFLQEVDGRKKAGLEEAIRYVQSNRDAMRYDQYLAAGYPIGSGVVEGACRHVVKDRMEGTGMRWQIEGAQNLLHLRTTLLNEEWSEFIQHRIKTEQTALYACSA